MKQHRLTWQVRGLLLLLLCMLAGRLSATPGSDKDSLLEATVLWFEEQEPGTEVYPVRMLITASHLRIDDGVDEGDFVLLDLGTQTIYSITHGEKSIMQFAHRSASADVPEHIKLTEEVQADPGAPAIGGKKPRHVQMLANGSVCYEAIVVPGLLQPAAGALARYARTLGDRQLNTLDNIPPEIQTPCFLSRYAYTPDAHYRTGFPVQEWDGNGYRRALVNYTEAGKVSTKLFEVPADYRVFRPGG